MKFTEIKEIEFKDAFIEFTMDLKSGKTSLLLKYTCEKCAGHGCNTHVYNNAECRSGTVYKNLDSATLDKSFDEKERILISDNVKQVFGKLFSSTSAHTQMLSR